MMQRRRSPYEEIVTPENERILGRLTDRAWAKFANLRVVADHLSLLDYVPERYSGLYIPGQTLIEIKLPPEFMDPTRHIVHEAIQTSGSVGGEHRKDLVEAIKGRPPPTVNLAASGNDNGQTTEAKRVPVEGRRSL